MQCQPVPLLECDESAVAYEERERQGVGVVLEIKAGPFAGKKIALANAQSILIGRAAERAQFAIPHDKHMSGVHFAVECGPSGCRVVDKKSTNGTHLNGAKIQEAMLASGDEIKSGQTVFVVRIVPDGQLPAVAASPQPTPQAPSTAPREIPSPAPSPTPDRAYKTPDAPPPSQSAQNRPAQRPASPSPHPPAPGQQPPALSIGSWAFHKIPTGWQIQEGLGIQQDVKDA